MSRRVRGLFPWTVALVVIGALAACRPNQSLEGQAKDAKIAAQIKTRLASQVNASTITAVEVNVTNGVATLAGPAHSAEESRQIEQVARSVEGVRDVRNELQILAPQTIVTPSAESSAASKPPGK